MNVTGWSMAEAPPDIKILAVDLSKDRKQSTATGEIWAYHVTIENNAGKDLSDLELR